MLTILRALPLMWQLGIGVAVLGSVAGGVAYWSVHEYNKGWNAAIAAVAAKDKEAIDAVKKSISDVDACAAAGRTWDTTSGVCN